jgi:MFS transporter, MHS family, shikimate and dehydroshikimate transport protein
VTTETGTPPQQPASTRTVAWATMVGTSIEWYDFYVYGTATALVFNKQFFPVGSSPLVGTLLAFSTYAVGFLFRPVGGVIFGHFGDRIGRKSMLVVTLSLMGAATFLIGLLPSYGSIGVAAPLLLVALRMIQGIGVGGEWGAAALMAVEHAPPKKRGLYGTWPQMGVPVGLLTANLAFIILSAAMPDTGFATWGWRVPFLASIILIIIGVLIRLRITESPEFESIKAAGKIERQPIIAVLRRQPKSVLRAAGMRFGENATFYIHTTYILTYGTEVVHLKRNDLLLGIIIVSALGIFSTPMWGFFSDRFGRRNVVLFGSTLMALLSWPFFWSLNSGSIPMLYLVLILSINVANNAIYSPQPAYYSELFDPEIRNSGASIGQQLASVFAGGLAPLIATALLAVGSFNLIALYMTAMALITLVTMLLSRDPYREQMLAERKAARPATA